MYKAISTKLVAKSEHEMKGLFFKNSKNEGYEIISDALAAHHDGEASINVVCRRLKDNKVVITCVLDIEAVFDSKSDIGY